MGFTTVMSVPALASSSAERSEHRSAQCVARLRNNFIADLVMTVLGVLGLVIAALISGN